MTITELIEKLERIRGKYGDISYNGAANNIGIISVTGKNPRFFLCETRESEDVPEGYIEVFRDDSN